MKHLLVSLVAALFSTQAAASGYYYIGGAGGKSKYTMASYSTVLTQARDDAYKVYFGMALAPQLAVELGYAALGTSEGNFEGIPMRFKADTAYVAVVGSFPLSHTVSLTGKLGTTGSTTRVESNVYGDTYHELTDTSSAMVGFGLRFDLGGNAALVAEYEHFGQVAASDEGEELRAGMVTVGLNIAF